MSNFEKWEAAFGKQEMHLFNHDAEGLLWLKVRAICRGKQLAKFLKKHHLSLTATKAKEKNRELFELLAGKEEATQWLDAFLRDTDNELYKTIGVDEEKLKSDLFNIREYHWGGDQTNSLDRYMVSHYVKPISDYNTLLQKRDLIAENAWKYVQLSWFNNWTSYLTESIFKKHPSVISAIGEIKSVDFFIKDYPIDLKVTFFPKELLQAKLKEKYGKSELSWLKHQARERGINFGNGNSNLVQYEILRKLEISHFDDLLTQFHASRWQVVEEAMQHPAELLRWLYENQGPMRFGTENRLFLILVNRNNMDESWEMKRQFDFIEPKVNDFLNHFSDSTLKEIPFTFSGRHYRALADVIFIIN